MSFWRSRRNHHSLAVVLVALLCVALVLIGATVQVVHAHPDGTIHNDCALCVTVHAVLAIVACVALLSLLANRIAPFVALRQKAFPRFDIPFVLSNRPPPSLLLASR